MQEGAWACKHAPASQCTRSATAQAEDLRGGLAFLAFVFLVVLASAFAFALPSALAAAAALAGAFSGGMSPLRGAQYRFAIRWVNIMHDFKQASERSRNTSESKHAAGRACAGAGTHSARRRTSISGVTTTGTFNSRRRSLTHASAATCGQSMYVPRAIHAGPHASRMSGHWRSYSVA